MADRLRRTSLCQTIAGVYLLILFNYSIYSCENAQLAYLRILHMYMHTSFCIFLLHETPYFLPHPIPLTLYSLALTWFLQVTPATF